MFTVDKLQQILKAQTSMMHFVIAYSGGLDSTVLLHALSQCKDLTITAVHVNHQLNPKSHVWAQYCQKVCDAFHIQLVVETIDIDLQPGDSLEEKARDARYAIFKKYLDSQAVLLTAHHLDDQAETFLLHALRGSGLKGLSAMPIKKRFADTYHIRPLLSFSRDSLEMYATKHALFWVDDDSNVDTRFDRNFLRHDIFPLLKKRFPAVMRSFSRSAELAAEAEVVIHEDIAILYADMTVSHEKINLKKLKAVSAEKQRYVLRHWLRENNVKMPSQKQLYQMQCDVVNAGNNADPIFDLGGMSIRRFQDFLYLVRSKKNLSKLPEGVRTRRPGDRVRLPGCKQSKSVKNYFQEQGIPPWERETILFQEETDGLVVPYRS